jgi:hypothetical protein
VDRLRASESVESTLEYATVLIAEAAFCIASHMIKILNQIDVIIKLFNQ